MSQIRISEAAHLLGVSDDTLRRWVSAGELSASVDSTGRKVIDGADLAHFLRERSTSLPAPSGTSSARNRFTGLVTQVTSDTVMSQVELQCGPYRMVSLMSTEAVRELGLKPGVLATASIKATHVVVDRPEGDR
ncbi:TOBE domain-containing protein [Nesterenkonia muleiensis]|uniref:TOBE domain-containing protein n=1 Tax=Nesterenkonia muleiensis TaxID=2282648 RepID=UPI000E71450E|nr:helix-turn-helix transcriptional regulator [Nesterenkonia muleiensis]